MKHKLVALNAVSLVETEKTLWKPLIEEFAKTQANYLYTPKDWPGRPKLEQWCQSHKKDMLEGGRIIEEQDLPSQGCEVVVSFEPLSSKQPRVPKTTRWASLDTRAENITASLKQCHESQVDKVISGILPVDLPEGLDENLIQYYEKALVYMPGSIDKPFDATHKREEITLFVYDSSSKDLLSRKTATAMAKLEDCVAVDIRDQQAVRKVSQSLINAKVCLHHVSDKEWQAYINLLAALYEVPVKGLGYDSDDDDSTLCHYAGLAPKNHEPPKEDQLLKEKFHHLLHDLEHSQVIAHKQLLENEVNGWQVDKQLEKFNQLSGDDSTIDWLVHASYNNTETLDWWSAPEKFHELLGNTPSAEKLRLRRQRYHFLKAYNVCIKDEIRQGLAQCMQEELLAYAKDLCSHLPRAEWLAHFAMCNKYFKDWLPSCEAAVEMLYQENEAYRGAYAVIAVGIVNGILPDLKEDTRRSKLLEKAHQLFNKDFETNRVLASVAYEECKLLAANHDIDATCALLKKICGATQDYPAAGMDLVFEHFAEHWYAICDPEKRLQAQPKALECLQLLDTVPDSVPAKHELVAYFRCYDDDLSHLHQFTESPQSPGFASLLALNLWNRDELQLAKAWLKRENINALETLQHLHYCAVTAVLLEEWDVAKASYKVMHAKSPDYFTDTTSNLSKWFLQALAWKAMGHSENEESYLDFAKKFDPQFEQRWIQWLKVKVGKKSNIVPEFAEPQL